MRHEAEQSATCNVDRDLELIMAKALETVSFILISGGLLLMLSGASSEPHPVFTIMMNTGFVVALTGGVLGAITFLIKRRQNTK